MRVGGSADSSERRLGMKKIIFLLILILLTVIILFSQVYKGKGRLMGTVSDEEGNPLEGVKVKLFLVRHNAGFEVVTDVEGRWVASWIRNGTWNIDFEKVGYEPFKTSVQVSEAGRRNPEVHINLKKAEGLLLTDELKDSLNEGNRIFDEGKYKESIEAYTKILEDYPEAYIILKNIGNAYFQMEDYDKAEEYYKKLLEKEPENNEAMMLIGNCYTNRGENEKDAFFETDPCLQSFRTIHNSS